MPRALRIEYPGACYHVMCRGDRREEIFRGDEDRELFLATLGEVCGKTGWRVHAYVLMPNHYHLVVETPEANLVAGMRWFQGTYTIRINRRHQLSGHLFQGRYRALVVDGRAGEYLATLSTYVHLNPVRARLVKPRQASRFRWSSAPDYGGKRVAPAWLVLDRVLGALALGEGAAGQRAYTKYLTRRAAEEVSPVAAVEGAYKDIRRGWCLGDESFRTRLLERGEGIGRAFRRGRSHAGGAATAHDEAAAESRLADELKRMRVTRAEVADWPWTDPRKKKLARLLRGATTITNAWVGRRLGGGHESTVSRAVHEQG